MSEPIYRALADHLNRLPGGFPPSSTGADLLLLEMLFTPREAGLAVNLTLVREQAVTIASRAGLPPEQAAPMLEQMAQKGLILSCLDADGAILYQAAPMVVGIYEFQVKNMTPELLSAFRAYWASAQEGSPRQTIPQMRTIPVGASIDPMLQALPYEQVYALVDAHEQFAVTNCICRHTARMRGVGCQAPEESCLAFGDWAGYYVRTGRGRSLDRAGVLEILARADAANLVLQPSNSQTVDFICTCCGCCCGVLRGLKAHPRPAERTASAFIARLNTEACQGCWTCLDRCQMDALIAGEEKVILKVERCIGCGLCVTTCPTGALALERKPQAWQAPPPPTLTDAWQIIAGDQASSR